MAYSPLRPRASVSPQLIDALLDAAVAAGVAQQAAAAALRIKVGIGSESSRRKLRLPDAALYSIWEAIVGLARGDHGVGMLLALHVDSGAFGVLGEAVNQSSTLLGAYEHIAQFSRLLHQGATFTVEKSSRHIVASYSLAGTRSNPATGGLAAGILWAVGNFALVPRRSFGVNLKPRGTHLECLAPPDMSLAREVFGARVRFEAPTSYLVFDRGELEAVCRPADARVLTYLDALADRELEDLPPVEDIIGVVTAELGRSLVSGIAAVARSLGMSQRTLQRRIEEAGSSFTEILDDVRKTRAKELIADSTRSMTEIAYMLGYTEQAAFSRASRRWFGAAPSELAGRSPSVLLRGVMSANRYAKRPHVSAGKTTR